MESTLSMTVKNLSKLQHRLARSAACAHCPKSYDLDRIPLGKVMRRLTNQ